MISILIKIGNRQNCKLKIDEITYLIEWLMLLDSTQKSDWKTPWKFQNLKELDHSNHLWTVSRLKWWVVILGFVCGLLQPYSLSRQMKKYFQNQRNHLFGWMVRASRLNTKIGLEIALKIPKFGRVRSQRSFVNRITVEITSCDGWFCLWIAASILP